jgi:hypothetical protein
VEDENRQKGAWNWIIEFEDIHGIGRQKSERQKDKFQSRCNSADAFFDIGTMGKTIGGNKRFISVVAIKGTLPPTRTPVRHRP